MKAVPAGDREGLTASITDLTRLKADLLAARDAYFEALEAYNAALADASAHRDHVVADLVAYAEGRTERWAEGPKGQAHAAWKDAWDDADLDEVAEPDLPDENDLDHVETLESLPLEPDP